MNREEIEQIWQDRSNWTWGVVYRSRQDPRVIVPRLWKWGGWTFNFDHPKAGLTGLLASSLTIFPALIAFLIFGYRTVTLIVMFLSIAALIFWANMESNRIK